jgi:hypothetical protein
MTITRSKSRIDVTGEVFTPMTLVYEILDKLPASVWEEGKTFIDNSCGDGNFLEGVFCRKVERYGHDVVNALGSIYGVDIMEDNIFHTRDRLLRIARELNSSANAKACRKIVNKNIVCHDALTYDYSFGEPSESLLTF